MSLTVIILTKNEALHIERAIESVRDIADRIFVVDSGSTDDTVARATELGAQVVANPWVNYATQLNWGLDQLPPDTDWVMRLDADEYVTPELAQKIKAELPSVSEEITGVFVPRHMTFLGRKIRHGGIFPVYVLRLFRHGKGRCENRWMDEHIKVDGDTTTFDGELIDDNLNGLTWWTEKHNAYASREVIDLLNLELRFMPHETVASLRDRRQVGIKRWLKERVYARLPSGMRAFAYFFYRYVFRFGFLDGREGTAFHVLQGLWYRYLVDAKLLEVKSYIHRHHVSAPEAVREVLGIDLDTKGKRSSTTAKEHVTLSQSEAATR